MRGFLFFVVAYFRTIHFLIPATVFYSIILASQSIHLCIFWQQINTKAQLITER